MPPAFVLSQDQTLKFMHFPTRHQSPSTRQKSSSELACHKRIYQETRITTNSPSPASRRPRIPSSIFNCSTATKKARLQSAPTPDVNRANFLFSAWRPLVQGDLSVSCEGSEEPLRTSVRRGGAAYMARAGTLSTAYLGKLRHPLHPRRRKRRPTAQ